ncbi:uncharacterized protein LOC126705285 [Quercus robur]|uniref:uncharacterized protein LOC126705285 n=1 Tax=Quercus robur TaxID=38942 RepID=UPI0021637B30|nr:uncharacterized protein LOC126705285 [Quercus robur]
MDSDDQLDDDEVLDDIGDEQEPPNEGNHESSPTMAVHQPSSLSFSQNTWDNMIDPTPPFEKPTQSIWGPTQEFYMGLLFADKAELRAAVKRNHIKKNQTFCATYGLFEVRKYNGPHTCTESTLTQDHEQLETHVIEKELKDVVKNDPTIKIASLQQTLYSKYQYRPSYFKVWEAKEKAIGTAFGDWDKSYQLLSKWLKALTDSNPGSRVIWRTIPATMPGCAIFERVFWAFGPSIDGFNIINVTNQKGLCLISDRHPGIMAAIRSICQSTCWYHRFCLCHVVSNFNQQIGNKNLKAMVMWAGMENQLRKYQIIKNRITQLSADGEKYLREMPVENWTLAYDGGHRYGAMTTNLSESFNGILKSARNLPITALVELTYYRCVAYFADRYTKACAEVTAGERITAYAKNKFNKWEKKSPKHSVTVFSHEDGLFEVRTPINANSAYRGNHRHEVYKIPCSNVIVVCKYQGISAMRYIDRCYHLEEQVACFAPRLRMVPDSVHWNEPNFPVLYPNVKLRREKG